MNIWWITLKTKYACIYSPPPLKIHHKWVQTRCYRYTVIMFYVYLILHVLDTWSIIVQPPGGDWIDDMESCTRRAELFTRNRKLEGQSGECRHRYLRCLELFLILSNTIYQNNENKYTKLQFFLIKAWSINYMHFKLLLNLYTTMINHIKCSNFDPCSCKGFNMS